MIFAWRWSLWPDRPTTLTFQTAGEIVVGCALAALVIWFLARRCGGETPP
jgi:hypothetical protein